MSNGDLKSCPFCRSSRSSKEPADPCPLCGARQYSFWGYLYPAEIEEVQRLVRSSIRLLIVAVVAAVALIVWFASTTPPLPALP